jgi:hypothetical protein
MGPEVIASNLVFMLPNASIYHFGLLCSTMHNAWMRIVCGRMKSDYRYSNTIVYNNFVWPTLFTEKQSEAIEKAAQDVLDARKAEEDRCMQAQQPCSLADLYAEGNMPAALRKAHHKLDKAVDAAYGYRGFANDKARVAFLFVLYDQLTNGTAPQYPVAVAKTATPRKPKAVALAV